MGEVVGAGSAVRRGGVVARVHRRYPALLPLVLSVGVLAAFFGGRMYSDWRDVKDAERLEAMRVRMMEIREGIGSILAPYGGPEVAWETVWARDPRLEYGSDLMVDPEDDPSRHWVDNWGIGKGAMREEGAAHEAADSVVAYLLADGWRVGDGEQRAGRVVYVKDDELGGWIVRISYTTEPLPAEQAIGFSLDSPYLFEK